MEIGKLTVQHRDVKGKGAARQLRQRGLVPGVCYGVGFDETLMVSVGPKALKAALDPAKRQNTLIDVSFEGGQTKPIKALLWDYQIDPIRREVTHFDLVSVDPEKKVEAEVEVVLTGKCQGVVDGGQLNVARHSVVISAKPSHIPSVFTVDISSLLVGEVIHVSDLEVPADVELVTGEALTIAACHAPRRDKALEAADAATAAAAGAGAEGEAAPAPEEAKKEEAGDKS